MRKLSNNPNVILSDANYPNGKIRNNTGAGNGTPVTEGVYGDIHVNKDKMMDLYGIIPNNLPDNETNGYQIIESLRALATKNDFILPISLNTGILVVPIKIGFMLENESVICKAGFNLSSETQIKGSDNVTLSFTANGSFKINEYVRLVKNASSINIIRIADEISLDDMLQTLVYLKKASQAEENAGTIDTKGTTPLTNKTAFIRRVNGVDSTSYLATPIQNGIYPKEHFSALLSLIPRNNGWFSGIDCGGGTVGDSMTRSGDIASVTISSVEPATGTGLRSSSTTYLVTLANNMDNLNYKVETTLQSEGTLGNDNDILNPIFKVISVSQFNWSISDVGNPPAIQNIKAHLKVIQL